MIIHCYFGINHNSHWTRPAAFFLIYGILLLVPSLIARKADLISFLRDTWLGTIMIFLFLVTVTIFACFGSKESLLADIPITIFLLCAACCVFLNANELDASMTMVAFSLFILALQFTNLYGPISFESSSEDHDEENNTNKLKYTENQQDETSQSSHTHTDIQSHQ